VQERNVVAKRAAREPLLQQVPGDSANGGDRPLSNSQCGLANSQSGPFDLQLPSRALSIMIVALQQAWDAAGMAAAPLLSLQSMVSASNAKPSVRGFRWRWAIRRAAVKSRSSYGVAGGWQIFWSACTFRASSVKQPTLAAFRRRLDPRCW
jgi:hypothetical protein